MKEFWKEYKISQALLSLVLAVIIWAFAIDSLNPTKVRSFSEIPVQFIGTELLEEQNLAVIEGENAAIRVYVEGKVNSFTNFDSKSITVTADLSEFKAPGEYQISDSDLNVAVSASSLQVSSYSPRVLNITIDRISSREFPVSAQVSGSPATGYRYRTPQLSKENIVVTGPESILDQIERVLVNVEANAIGESMIYTAPVVFVDAEQNVIQSDLLIPEVDTIDVTIRVTKEGEIPLQVDVIPSDTLDSDDVTIAINPETISVHADQTILENYAALTLGQIDLSTLNLSGNYTFPIELPARLTPLNEVPAFAEVSVEVKDQQIKNFVITEFDLHDVSGSPADVDVRTESVSVSITGVRQFVESLTAEDFLISLSYDSSALGEGEHELQAKISLKQAGNYELSSNTVPLKIVLKHSGAQEGVS